MPNEIDYMVMNALSHTDVIRLHAFLISFGLCFVYAILDEVHQYFVPGIKDVLIDSAGAFIGIMLFMQLFRRHD